MPPVTAFNLRKEDPLQAIEGALRDAIASLPALEIDDDEVDFVPVLAPDGFDATVTRIFLDPWVAPAQTKEALQDLATRMALAFRSVVGEERRGQGRDQAVRRRRERMGLVLKRTVAAGLLASGGTPGRRCFAGERLYGRRR